MSGRTYVVQDNHVVEDAGAPPGPRRDGEGGLTDLLGTGPLFEVARRGYDRLAVDAYVEATEEELRSLRRKLHTVLRRFHATADALVEARQRPEDSAGDILAQARAEAEARMVNVHALREAASAARDEARADRARAAAELQTARREAAELVAAAHAAREEAEATAALRLAALESEMADLRRQRDEARAYLRRLTGQVEQALQSLTAVLPDEAGLSVVRDPGREVLAG